MTTQAATLLVVLLSNQGYWFGGQAGTIRVRWAMREQVPEAVLQWQLMFGSIRVAEDRVTLPADGQGSTIRVTPPAVRVPTQVRWVWQLCNRDGDAIGSGEQVVHLYPEPTLEPLRERLRDRRIVVWDEAKGLPAALQQGKIPFVPIQKASELEFLAADIILVGPGQIDASAFSQTALAAQARAGRSVMVFEQHDPTRLDEYALLRRPAPHRVEMREGHPLLRDLAAEDVQSLLGGPSRDVWAVQLPANEPALEVIWWPRDVPGNETAPIDAILVTRRQGQGRIVLCQLPLEPWQQDPRSHILLRNALDYLLTRPEPTPRPSERSPVSQPSRSGGETESTDPARVLASGGSS
jgi:hypothetical protein